MGIDEDATREYRADFDIPNSDAIEEMVAETAVGQKRGRAQSAVVKEPQLKITKLSETRSRDSTRTR